MLGLSEAERKRLKELQYEFNLRNCKIIQKMEDAEIKRVNDIDNKVDLQNENKECEELGHMNTWMPKDKVLCMRCGALNQTETEANRNRKEE